MARRGSASGGQVVVDGYREAMKALKEYGPEARKEFNKELRKTVGGPVLSDAKRHAQWSTRIPKALALSVTQKGVGIRIKRSKAPHGSIYERGTKNNRREVRHPLFGNYDRWYGSPVKPFIQPALDGNRAHIIAASEAALRRAATKVGL